MDSIYPDCVKHTVELFRPEGIAELGMAIVGGNDTPIRNIIIQGIIPGSLVDEDGRIKAGDIIIDVSLNCVQCTLNRFYNILANSHGTQRMAIDFL